MLTPDRLEELLAAFRAQRVLVVGDCMLDEYVWGRVSRISPEAPVIVVEEERTTYAAGGACNVAANIASLGAHAAMVGAVGDDGVGDRLARTLAERGVSTRLVTLPGRRTTLKTRVIARSQQVVRVDREDRAPLDEAHAGLLVEAVAAALNDADVLLLSDYEKGALTPESLAAILRLTRERGVPVTAGPKPATIRHYPGVALLSLNRGEAEAATGRRLPDTDTIFLAGEPLRNELAATTLFVTCGGEGIVMLSHGRAPRHLPPRPLEVYDSAGAGDSVLAAATLALAAGATPEEMAELGNLGGAAQVRHLGVAAVTPDDLRHAAAPE